ncbi:hypothetical protein GUITHDRAFT_93861 [Guillardia theta CCMP2712]|uniref:Enoyl reductase (ER) domain-containing protein n=2 Tax=Guillardia theta TaxID=55529 RepID=L1JHA8_GUITC|nr:hypothetical protein GUITHDRAFT_93861 [Guillardia theta CCMP2712]EKX47898.1 hypothetical protein GUITHDRAFT_93861 [Guillardia theta CCMP2712]|eukprot:XP_005834878.1 hypothetical protein GUITHDRAFT_93861 [Guillardia theta CCMP2712]
MYARPIPWPGEGEMLLRVRSFAVSGADLEQVKGRFVAPRGCTDIIGMEVSGEIMIVDEETDGMVEGGAVCAMVSGGGYAEFCVCKKQQALLLPRGFDWNVAAAMPLGLCVAWSCLFELAELKEGTSVLIHGGAGGVGHIMIQVARNFGIEVFTTCRSKQKVEFCLSLGADYACESNTEDIDKIVRTATCGKGVDAVIDCIGGDTIDRNIQLLKPGGKLVFQGCMVEEGKFNIQRLIEKKVEVLGCSIRNSEEEFKNKMFKAIRTKVWPLVLDGKIRPHLSSVYRMSEVQTAIAKMREETRVGKLVCSIGGEFLKAAD